MVTEMADTARLVVLISGSGGVLQAIANACRHGDLDAEVAAVFSHEPYAYGLLRAEREDLPAFLHDISEYRLEGRTEEEYATDLADRVEAFEPDYVVMAEWRLPLNAAFFERFPGRIINLHAGLPGQFPVFDPYTQNPIMRAYDAYTSGLIHETGVTAHILREPNREGAVLAEERVPIYEFDTLRDVEERFFRTQQELLTNVLRHLIEEHDTSYVPQRENG